jgi:diguanylate cyclase (GGDEF)-like protein
MPKQIAEAAMSGVTRPGDLVARFGGEEFAVILPHTNDKGAIEVAQAICDALRRRKIPHQDNPTGVITVSAGCVTMVPALGQNARNLIAMADEALYRAKHRGRNQVCIWNDPHQASDKHSLIA